MVPFRSSRTRSQALAETAPNRTRAGQIDHDVFEGLPVRRWSRQHATFSQTPKHEELDTTAVGPNAMPELPMPRDSNLLTPLSRSLLRAARSGCTYIKPVRKDPDVEEKEVKGEEPAGPPPTYERTFTTVKWTTIPRNLEPPEVEFLAKRRPGLPSLYGAGAVAVNTGAGIGVVITGNHTPMRKTKFKKVDAATGQVAIYEAWVPEGHRVEGEITDETEITTDNPDVTIVSASPAPGTVVDGVGVVDQEGVVVAEPEGSMVAVVRRRHPPPKRKAKGIGRGRKKKVMFTQDDVAASPAHGNGGVGHETGGRIIEPSSQRSDQEDKHVGGEEEEEDEDEEDGDGSEEEEEFSEEAKSQTKPETPPTTTAAEDQKELPKEQISQQELPENVPRDKSSSPDLPLSKAAADRTETTTTENYQEARPTNDLPEASSSVLQVEKASDSQPEVQKTEHEEANEQQVASNPDEPLQPAEGAQTEEETSARSPQSTNVDVAPPSIPEPSEEQAKPETNITPDPTKTSASPVQPEAGIGPVRFEDGEVDLLGSLEASLDNPAQPSEEQSTDHLPEQKPENQETVNEEQLDVTMAD
ncbi:hypothetical protein D8B26_005283 [Coccidioides posadasii str. Silveira]|uniref:Uncharacterized protein n=1 Tax=Coccidioides posadasii (strain RMSCC 757 / Silveira) TaxID=443226 RepID=E9D4S9_COCPS|nr:conserved hypothetical protein [Coccidioides posadasii str. Silveira]QVM10630.1 hypothetical protein D8B26_005283 [Coccidioides posadasii str. Silveira]